MSEDEDEELAMLRLQALMSKRRAGSGASKDLLFPISLALVPVTSTAQVSTAPMSIETRVTAVPVVVTSVTAAETDPPQDTNNDDDTYRQQHFGNGQVPRRGQLWFPESRGGFSRDSGSSSNLIVIQTTEGDPEPSQQPSATQRLRGPRSQMPSSSSTAPPVLLRPQDKWESKGANTKAKPKVRKVTKFSRYNESSDSDEADTSDSESSSTDNDNDDDVDRLALSEDNRHSPDATDASVTFSVADSPDGVNNSESANVSEHSSAQQITDTEGPAAPAEQADLPTKDSTDRPSSPSHKSDSSSLSSNDTPPSPIRTPLKLESPGHSLASREFRKDVPMFQQQEQTNTRRSLRHKHESSASHLRHHLQLDNRSERSPLRTTESLRSSPAKNSSSASNIQLRPVRETSSPHQHLAARRDMKCPLRPRSQERQPTSVNGSKSRSRSSERRSSPPSPSRSQYNEVMGRRQYSSGADYAAQPRAHSRSLSPLKWTSQSQKKDLPRPSCSQSSSISSRVRSPSKSRSRSRGKSPLCRQRSGSIDSRSRLPASSGDGHFAGYIGSRSYGKSPTRYRPATDAYREAACGRSSRSLSAERESVTRYPRDVSPHPTAESDKASKYQRSYSRSPDRIAKQPLKPDTRPLPCQEFLGKPRSKSRSSSQDRSQSPMLLDGMSPRRRFSPSQHGVNKLNDGTQDSGIYRFGRSLAKPADCLSGRLPDVRDRLGAQPSVVRKQSDRTLASRRRLPDNRPSVHNSPISQRHQVQRLPQRANEMIQSRISKRLSPSSPNSISAEAKSNSQYRPRNFISKMSAKSEDEPRTLAQNKCSQNLTDLQLKHRRTSADRSEDSDGVERWKKWTEPDKPWTEPGKPLVEEQSESRTESTRSPHGERLHTQEPQDERTKGESASAEKNGKISAGKTLTLKRPGAPVATLLEARKRRFHQSQNSDSRSVCIRSSPDARNESRAKLHRQLSPEQLDKSKQLGKGVKEAIDRREISDKSKTRGMKEKMRTATSEISALTSADSSMSLEDISEDETPVRDRQFGELPNPQLILQRRGNASKLGMQGNVGRERDRADDDSNDDDDDDDDVMDRKSSTLSSIVKAVKKDSTVSEAHHSDSRHHQSTVSKAQSTSDDSHESDDNIVTNTPKRNVVRKELSGVDAQLKQQRVSVHSRLGSVSTASKVDNPPVVAAAAKSIDLRERLRGVEPAAAETLRQADTSHPRWGFPSKRRRRRR